MNIMMKTMMMVMTMTMMVMDDDDDEVVMRTKRRGDGEVYELHESEKDDDIGAGGERRW